MKAIQRMFSAVLVLSALSGSALLFLPGCAQHESVEDFEDEEEVGEVQSELNEMNVAHCANVVSPNWTSAFHSKELEIIAEINKRRAAGVTCSGTGSVMPPVPQVTKQDALRCASRKHSKDMVVQDYMSHVSPDGKTSADRRKAAGYTSSSSAGEIIHSSSTERTPEHIVNGWIKSTTGHCEGLMKASHKHVGVGYYSANGRYRTTANFANPL